MKKIKKIKKLDNKKLLIIGIVLVFIIAIITIIMILKPKEAVIIPNAEEIATASLQAKNIYEESIDVSLATINATKEDTSGVHVKDGAIVALRDSVITKYDGLISDKNKALEVGLNSAMIVSYGSEAKLSGSKVETSVEYSNAIFISGKKAKLNVVDTDINTYAFKSSGIVIATSSKLEMEHSNITTKFKSSPAITIKEKEGTAKINNSYFETSSLASPIIKSKGNIEITNSTGSANGSTFGLIEDGNVTVSNVTLIASGANDTDDILPSGFNIFDTTSKTTLSISNSSLNINSKLPYYKSAIMFQIKNAETEINLNNVQLNSGSNKIATITNSTVLINCDNQNLEGTIELDNISSIELKLSNDSFYIGKIINGEDSKLILDSSSEFILTGDTYIKELVNENSSNSNIKFNNHKLYVNGNSIN